MAAQKSARPLGHWRTLLQIGDVGLRKTQSVGSAARSSPTAWLIELYSHQLAEDGLRLVETLVPGLVLAKDDRHPFRRADHLRRTRDGEQEPLELVIAQRSGRPRRMIEEGSEH